jgi:hypothetical protein
MEDENIASLSDYLQVVLMKDRLDPNMYLEYRRQQFPDHLNYDSTQSYLLTTDDWIANSNLGELRRVNFSLPEDLLSTLDCDAKVAGLTRTKIIVIGLMRDLSEPYVYYSYRGIFDKVWLYKFFRTEFNMKHEDDTEEF